MSLLLTIPTAQQPARGAFRTATSAAKIPATCPGPAAPSTSAAAASSRTMRGNALRVDLPATQVADHRGQVVETLHAQPAQVGGEEDLGGGGRRIGRAAGRGEQANHQVP